MFVSGNIKRRRMEGSKRRREGAREKEKKEKNRIKIPLKQNVVSFVKASSHDREERAKNSTGAMFLP